MSAKPMHTDGPTHSASVSICSSLPITENQPAKANDMNRPILTLLLLLCPITAYAQSVITITDADVSGDVTWTSDNTYVLDGFVFVEDGSSLTIEAGTIVKGLPGQGENASALIVARGGKIFAEGDSERPIIFTAESDDITDPEDLPIDARGLWGGVIILGHAGLNSAPGETAIEGIPTSETRGIYGGDDDEDDSGVFRFVSIRYGGSDIGAGNEINGLTMGGVGSGTTVEYVEVFNNQDDGFEWFGGTVNTRFLVSAFNGDDAFDYDEGFRGRGQFWFAVQAEDTGNRAGEHDGGTSPEDGTPFAIPVISNVTYLGSGATSANAENDAALQIRDNSGGKYFNSIFHDFVGRAVHIEDLETGQDSRARLEAGDLVFEDNIFGTFGADELSTQSFAVDYLTAAAQNNRLVDPQLRGISRTTDGALDPRPSGGSPAIEGAQELDDPWFIPTDYVGAFGEVNWAAEWTFAAEANILTSDGAGIIDTATEPEGDSVPASFALSQNYPNPFNPSTTINFEFDRTQHVRLAVYDVLGREIEVLVDGTRTAGSHRVEFGGSDLSSGTYLYVLETTNGSASRTMSLTK